MVVELPQDWAEDEPLRTVDVSVAQTRVCGITLLQCLPRRPGVYATWPHLLWLCPSSLPLVGLAVRPTGSRRAASLCAKDAQDLSPALSTSHSSLCLGLILRSLRQTHLSAEDNP